MLTRWIVTGASGQLGGHLLRALDRDPGTVVLALTRGRETALSVGIACVELSDVESLRAAVRLFKPTHVLHVGAMTAVGDCYSQPDLARRINTDATRALAETAAECNARFLFSSTDMVFDGASAPYRETDEPRPLSIYGRTKHDAESATASLPGTLIVRIPLLYGMPATARATTFASQIASLCRGEPLKLFTDEFRTPVWLADAAAALIGLARSDLTGIIHIAGPQRLSRLEMVRRFAELLKIESPKLDPVSRLSIQSAEPRPADLSLDGSRFAAMFPQLAPGAIRAAALHST